MTTRGHRSGSVNLREAMTMERDQVGGIRDQGVLGSENQLRQPMVSPRKVRDSTLREKHYFYRGSNSVATDETQQNRKPTASPETKLILRRVKESPNAYAPLKSVAESLCFVLDSCEVCPHPSCILSAMLKVVPANGSEGTIHRILSAPNQSAF